MLVARLPRRHFGTATVALILGIADLFHPRTPGDAGQSKAGPSPGITIAKRAAGSTATAPSTVLTVLS